MARMGWRMMLLFLVANPWTWIHGLTILGTGLINWIRDAGRDAVVELILLLVSQMKHEFNGDDDGLVRHRRDNQVDDDQEDEEKQQEVMQLANNPFTMDHNDHGNGVAVAVPFENSDDNDDELLINYGKIIKPLVSLVLRLVFFWDRALWIDCVLIVKPSEFALITIINNRKPKCGIDA